MPIGPATADGRVATEGAVTAGHDVLTTTGPPAAPSETGTNVVVTDEEGHPAWRAFAAVLRHAPTGQTHVVRAGPPPERWTHCGPLQYRWRADNVVTRVVPARLVPITASQMAQHEIVDRLPELPRFEETCRITAQ
ncbi:hypothetical protein A8926_3360 [Saccharopolyspora spinosa]|uniref:Uncharacterized protein n=1 Tax=Saccharopolyspora spinosa TaxID=60894 RepID=A0A2N3XYB5_SACSN|nr:hypothetical protein A8926_3360 [Saccharopolyspora spinosa]